MSSDLRAVTVSATLVCQRLWPGYLKTHKMKMTKEAHKCSQSFADLGFGAFECWLVLLGVQVVQVLVCLLPGPGVDVSQAVVQQHLSCFCQPVKCSTAQSRWLLRTRTTASCCWVSRSCRNCCAEFEFLKKMAGPLNNSSSVAAFSLSTIGHYRGTQDMIRYSIDRYISR